MKKNFYYNLGKHKLFPICRSLTGEGNKKTLNVIKKVCKKIKIYKFKSGSKVYDWKIPEEWNISDAYVKDKFNKKIINFKKNNLHLVGYSIPKKKYVNKIELLKHIHSLPKEPNAIPYVTSYYKKYWGFCTTHKEKKIIDSKYNKKDKFKIFINSKFNKKGHMLVGEYFLKGTSSQEIFISTYICHPSLANDNLSGILVSLNLINYFNKIKKLNKSIRFVFLPETIGAIAYLNKKIKELKKNVIGGFNLTCLGDENNYSFIPSKYNNSPSDFAITEVYKKLGIKARKYSFLDRGSDERQYNSPGIELPITTIFRSKFGNFKEYHTSLDNFSFITSKGLRESFNILKKAIIILMKKKYPITTTTCEPFMSKRNLYPTISKKDNSYASENMLNFLQYSDGRNDLKKISKLIKLSLKETISCSRNLLKLKLIKY